MFLRPAGPDPEGHSVFWLIMMGAAGTVWSYAGFPNIMYMAGEVKNPQRNIPVALIGCAIFVTLMYVLISFASGAIIPHEELIAKQGFLNPFKYLPVFADFAAAFLAVAAFISCVGATNVCVMSQPRLQYAMARDGLFFSTFGRIHPRFGTPVNSILLQSGFAIILVFLSRDTLDALLGYFTFSYLFQNILVYGSIFWLRKREDYRLLPFTDLGSSWPFWRSFCRSRLSSQVSIPFPFRECSSAWASRWPAFRFTIFSGQENAGRAEQAGSALVTDAAASPVRSR
ncbi:MAG: amino acid permease [Candidatus Marinimicrobia bacterium]|nr:amino acid permease [Candidatus Neomarinimicrobiota bacterium]